jgi:hypothetical protein
MSLFFARDAPTYIPCEILVVLVSELSEDHDFALEALEAVDARGEDRVRLQVIGQTEAVDPLARSEPALGRPRGREHHDVVWAEPLLLDEVLQHHGEEMREPLTPRSRGSGGAPLGWSVIGLSPEHAHEL